MRRTLDLFLVVLFCITLGIFFPLIALEQGLLYTGREIADVWQKYCRLHRRK